MLKRTLLALLAAWPALGMGGLSCLQTGCASDLSLGAARWSVRSMDYTTIGETEDGPAKQPLWAFTISSSQTNSSFHWDGVAIAEKAIEETFSIIGRVVDGVVGTLPTVFGGGS
jgi:hypothetical protein